MPSQKKKHAKYFINCYQGTLSHIKQQDAVMKMLISLLIIFHFLPMLVSNSMFVFPQAIGTSLSLSGTEIRNLCLQFGMTRE